jgi:hypothetical protein
MMDKDIFKERERSFEEEYFRRHDAKLIEKLRERAKLDEIVEALAVKLQIDDPVLLRRIIALGVTLDTGAAFLLAPLVQVAWAEGAVTDREREKVLHIATERGVATSSPAYTLLPSSGCERVRPTRSSTRPSRSSRLGSPSSRRRNALTASSGLSTPVARWRRHRVASGNCSAWVRASRARRSRFSMPWRPRCELAERSGRFAGLLRRARCKR